MFARKLEFDLMLVEKEEFLRKVRDEVLPILKNQAGFLDILGLTDELKVEKTLLISLWETKDHALKYEKEVFPKITAMLKPYLLKPFIVPPAWWRPPSPSTFWRPPDRETEDPGPALRWGLFFGSRHPLITAMG